MLTSVVLLIVFPAFSSAEINTDVTDINYWSYPDYTRIVITLSERTEFSQKTLKDPDRLYFDISNSRIHKEIKANQTVSNDMLKSIRAAQFNEKTVRVVLDLERIRDYKITSMDDPVRIIIDVFGYAAPSMTKRIVIDPGHGGHDPGAVGPNKLYEKDVVLDIALKLKKILSENPNLEVFLTREKDIFLRLEERTAIANSKHADLFVSVHANASPRSDAKGIETYFLNWTNDEEAMRVAARENQISLKKMRKMQKEIDILDVMLGDLKRDNKRDESLKLANYIQHSLINELKRDYKHVIDLKVKKGPFYVLYGAEMSSALVEVSFISNPFEERLLAREIYRGDLAKSIAYGITRYMASSPESQTFAGVRKSVVPRD